MASSSFRSAIHRKCPDCTTRHSADQPFHQYWYLLLHAVAYTFNTATTFGTKPVNWQPLVYNYVFTYPKADTNYRTGVSIAQINYFMPASRQLNYTLDVGVKKTVGVTFLFFANTANRINLLTISILTL